MLLFFIFKSFYFHKTWLYLKYLMFQSLWRKENHLQSTKRLIIVKSEFGLFFSDCEHKGLATEMGREINKVRERQRKRQRQRKEKERHKEKEKDRHKERKKERKRKSETETQRQRKRQRKREKERNTKRPKQK